jgi:hypothetical protein
VVAIGEGVLSAGLSGARLHAGRCHWLTETPPMRSVSSLSAYFLQHHNRFSCPTSLTTRDKFLTSGRRLRKTPAVFSSDTSCLLPRDRGLETLLATCFLGIHSSRASTPCFSAICHDRSFHLVKQPKSRTPHIFHLCLQLFLDIIIFFCS